MEKYWKSMFNYNLTSLISRSKRRLQIICLRGFTSTNSREALVKCLSVCPRYAAPKLGTSLWSASVLALMGYPSFARNRTRALSSPLPFHFVISYKYLPAMHLAAHGKSSILYGRSYGRWWVTTILHNYGSNYGTTLRAPLWKYTNLNYSRAA